MPRKPHSYHYIYKTTCQVNSKYYIGMHSTSNLEDGYMGSGIRIWRSLKKYGRENHVFEILEFLPDRKMLADREREIVNHEVLKDPLCLNLSLGGSYSSGTKGKKFSEDTKKKMSEWERTVETRQKMSEAASGKKKSSTHRENISKSRSNRSYTLKESEARSASTREMWKDSEYRERIAEFMRNREVTPETRQKMSENCSFSSEKLREINRLRMSEKVKCPHCEKTGGRGAMQRHHFNNCKKKL